MEELNTLRALLDSGVEHVSTEFLAKCLIAIDTRLQAVERWQETEDTRDREASEYGPE